ncbi:MAG: hypothetical protein RMJ44_10905 [Cytophagales bacterium]|nr:hypothetical protein [Cytophagales bacterium]
MWNERQLWLATIALTGVYFAYSFSAEGFYQQDEAAHFLSMRGFWFNPHSILSNWAKPGYKLIYALPALGGVKVVVFFNCLVAGLTAQLSYRIAHRLNSQIPALAFFATAMQPLWFNLAFRNYSEILTALLLALSMWLQLGKREKLAALGVSYIAFIRQEFYPFLGLYFLWFAWQRKWIAAMLLATFPLVQHTWGWAITGDVFYLLHQVLKSSSEIGSAYPRKGFDHYFLMSVTIYGAPVVLGVVVYLTMKLLQPRQQWQELFNPPAETFVWLVFVLYFFMYCLFNWQAVPIGPSGGGNLRYLLVISPLGAVMTTLALERWDAFPSKQAALYVIGALAILVAVFMTYQHNYVVFTNERDWRPFILTLLSIAALLVPTGRKKWGVYSALLIFSALLTVRPIKLSQEDAACQQLAEWYRNYEQRHGEPPALYLHHDMFYYYLGRTRYEFKSRPQFITDANAKAAPKGSLFIWDSHYSYRPELRKESLTYEYFTSKPEQYELIHQIVSKDQTFGVLVFRKL